MSDMVKNDEINSSTGKIGVINKIKTISSSPEQINEMIQLSSENKKLSSYDIIGFITARDNNGILATGDNRLKIFSEGNNVEVIRTLKIIELLALNKIIDNKKAINACELLKNTENTRIPKEKIDELINKLKRNSI